MRNSLFFPAALVLVSAETIKQETQTGELQHWELSGYENRIAIMNMYVPGTVLSTLHKSTQLIRVTASTRQSTITLFIPFYKWETDVKLLAPPSYTGRKYQ